MKFSIQDFFSKCDQIRKKLRIWSHLLKKSWMENFIFCAVYQTSMTEVFCESSSRHDFYLASRQLFSQKRFFINIW